MALEALLDTLRTTLLHHTSTDEFILYLYTTTHTYRMSPNLYQSSCSQYETSLDWNFYISILLCLGIFLSYVPQHVRIVRRRSSEGISPWFLLLGITSGFCALFNILLISKNIYSCCKVISAGHCFSASLGILQISAQALASVLILLFALVFTRNQTMEPKEDYYKLQYFGKISLSFFVVVGALSWYAYFNSSEKSISLLANILGIVGSVLAGLQYFPQIYTTAHLQHVGSLSITMMIIQTPGGFIWSASLAARKDTVWSSWLPYFTAACLQGVLLIMACYFELKNRRLAKDAIDQLRVEDESYGNNTEVTPLLQ